ncbi:MAG: hypothetical protein KJP07_13925 [Desulfatitalea sp.]|nr:hypothetical protein [Desulfatitalea sp.]
MDALARQTCYHHPHRETVARCPACKRFFCRECVTEHDDRMLCSECLARLVQGKGKRRGPWIRHVITAMQGAGGFFLLWFTFYLLGKALLAIPHTFHEGTIWQSSWWLTP